MARKRQLTPDVIAKIQARRRAGVPYSDLAREFGLSIGSVHKAANAPPDSDEGRSGSAKKTKPRPSVVTTEARQSAEVAPEPPDGGAGLLALLERQVDILDELAQASREDPAAFTAISRVLNGTVALLAKMQPPPPVDHENAPDMVAAAKRCREKLHELLGRAMGTAAADGAEAV